MVAFRPVPILNGFGSGGVDPIEALGYGTGYLYLGTKSGWVFRCSVSESAAPEDCIVVFCARQEARQVGRRPVEQIIVLPNGQGVLVQCDGDLRVLPDALENDGTVLLRAVTTFCIHTGTDSNIGVEVLVSVKKKLIAFSAPSVGGKFVMGKEFTVPESPTALAWHGSFICAAMPAYQREYILMNDTDGMIQDIAPLVSKSKPRIVVLPENNELVLMIQDGLGIFFSLTTQMPSTKSTVQLPRNLVGVAVSHPYLVGVGEDGHVMAYSIRDQSVVMDMKIGQSQRCFIGSEGGKLFCAHDVTVTGLVSVPFENQLQEMLEKLQIADALELFSANFPPNHSQRDEQLQRFHLHAGWALFYDLQFPASFQHFTFALAEIGQLLAFWKKYLPSNWTPRVPSSKHFIVSASYVPEPTELVQFVRTRLQEKQGSVLAMDDKGRPPSIVTDLVELANASISTFLSKQRIALLPVATGDDKEVSSKAAEDARHLLVGTDTVLLKLLVEAEDRRWREFLDSPAGVFCDLQDCIQFLRRGDRHDVVACLYSSRKMRIESLAEWARILNDETLVPPFHLIYPAAVDLADVLVSCFDRDDILDLLHKYIPILLSKDPTAALKVFTAPAHGKVFLKIC